MNASPRANKRLASHPYAVEALAQLPDGLRDLAFQNFPRGEEFDFIYVIPADVYARKAEPEKALVFCTHGLYYVQASNRLKGQATIFLRAENVLHVRLSLILLYGCLEIIATTAEGATERLAVEYNMAGHLKLWPHLAGLLEKVSQDEHIPAVDPQVEALAWDVVKRSDLKYLNGLRYYAQLPDEHLVGAVFQPEIRSRYFPGFSRQVVPPSLITLTDRQVIAVGEPGKGHHEKYGWVIDFFPRFSIQEIGLQPQDEGQCLSIQVSRRSHHVTGELFVSPAVAGEWLALWNNGR